MAKVDAEMLGRASGLRIGPTPCVLGEGGWRSTPPVSRLVLDLHCRWVSCGTRASHRGTDSGVPVMKSTAGHIIPVSRTGSIATASVDHQCAGANPTRSRCSLTTQMLKSHSTVVECVSAISGAPCWRFALLEGEGFRCAAIAIPVSRPPLPPSPCSSSEVPRLLA